MSAVVGGLLLAPPSQAAEATKPFSGVVQAAAGDDFTCAVRTDRTVWCWGANEYGQLGDSTTDSRELPVQVQDLAGVVQVTAGGVHACAVRSDRTVWCWGSKLLWAVG
ncbi:MAG: RCC1 domain-containing protein [Actinomycetes bacterium]